MRPFDYALGAALAAGLLAGVRWTSTAPMTAHASPNAVLRLAWSARPERLETCRRPGEAEQSNLPRHMQQALICEGRAATYRLRVRESDSLVDEQVVRAGGLRHDRRLYVFHELPLPAGRTRVHVDFERIEQGESDRRSRSNVEAVPARLVLDQEITLRPREVVLVTYDEDRRALVAVEADPDDGGVGTNSGLPGATN